MNLNIPRGGERQPLLASPAPSSRSDISAGEPWYGTTPNVKNEGSPARDFCAVERTFLVHLRFGLVLFVLAASFLCRSRFPHPGKPPVPDKIAIYGGLRIPLAGGFAGAALLTLLAGWIWYETAYRSLRRGKAFIEGESKLHEVILGCVSALILAAALLLFFDDLEAKKFELPQT